MAYLRDVPKFALGTAIELAGAANEATDDDDEPVAQQPGSASTCTQMTESELHRLILGAIKFGCRHFDCAPLYKTQRVVGAALAKARKCSQVQRNQLFVTSKLSPNMMRVENIERCLRNSLAELQLDYLDLFLIHAPFSTKHISDEQVYPTDSQQNLLLDQEDGLLERAWLKLCELKKSGLVRYVGLSNVNIEQLTRLNELSKVDVVQNEYHIYNQDKSIFDYCEEIDVHFEAYAAFGSPQRALELNLPCPFSDPIVNRVAHRYSLSVAQVTMQWLHQQPLSYVVRCDSLRQLEENLRATQQMSVCLNDLIDLDCLNKNVRLYLFDEHRGVTRHKEYPFRRSPSNNLDDDDKEERVAQLACLQEMHSRTAPRAPLRVQVPPPPQASRSGDDAERGASATVAAVAAAATVSAQPSSDEPITQRGPGEADVKQHSCCNK